MIQDPDIYFTDGCGRCTLFSTPECKVHLWTRELIFLREVILETGLQEEAKWGAPCYTYDDNNIVMIGAFKDHCTLSFFKDALLNNEENLLEKPGENTQAARIFKVMGMEDLDGKKELIQSYIYEAIEAEKAGLEVTFKKNPEPMPKELIQKMEEDAVFKNAFEALTPGRQRGYIIYISGAKQSSTRQKRIEKYTEQILNGVGLHDKYNGRK